jgi:hypothetical protein
VKQFTVCSHTPNQTQNKNKKKQKTKKKNEKMIANATSTILPFVGALLTIAMGILGSTRRTIERIERIAHVLF